MPKSVTVSYYDDEISQTGRDAQKIKELLDKKNKFKCELFPPPKHFSELPSDFNDAVLVDFDLNVPLQGDKPVGYFGSTLASEIRMRQPTCPIILITRPQVIGTKEPYLDDNLDVDMIIFKDDVISDPNTHRQKIIALINGFQTLANLKPQSWDGVLESMDATSEEAQLLREAGPPLEKHTWYIPQMAKWIRHTIISYPGILYNDLTAATRLGISLESFLSQTVQTYFASAQYHGPFKDLERRWWRDRLFSYAYDLIYKYSLQGTIAHTFSKAFHSEHNESLQPALCVYDKTPIADWVCHILQKPVKQQHSYPYYPDSRPPVMDQARVSFKAIKESNKFDENLVDGDSLDDVYELQEQAF